MHDPALVEQIEALGRAAATGAPGAIDDLLRVCEPMVLRVCSKFLPNRQDAEEACQDALLAITRSVERFEGRARFTTWLYQVAANCSRSTYRSLRRRAVEIGEPEAHERPDPQTTSVIAGSRVDLTEALDRLDTRLASPVMLRDVLGLDYSEIAAHLDIPEGTVKSRIHEARRQLQRHLTIR